MLWWSINVRLGVLSEMDCKCLFNSLVSDWSDPSFQKMLDNKILECTNFSLNNRRTLSYFIAISFVVCLSKSLIPTFIRICAGETFIVYLGISSNPTYGCEAWFSIDMVAEKLLKIERSLLK